MEYTKFLLSIQICCYLISAINTEETVHPETSEPNQPGILPSSCAEVFAKDYSALNGIYTIKLLRYNYKPFNVYCERKNSYPGWTVIMRRQAKYIDMDFYHNWTDYKEGFGQLKNNFFIGLDKLYAMTRERPQELLITITDYNGGTHTTTYEQFEIGNENERYYIKVLGTARGDAGHILQHRAEFSTKDNDNNKNHCTSIHLGGWWYENGCGNKILTGKDLGDKNYWKRYAEMAIRPRI